MYIYHNSQQALYRQPFGAVPTGTSITLRLLVRGNPSGEKVLLRLWTGTKEVFHTMRKAGNVMESEIFEATIKTPKKPCLLWYYFIIKTASGDRYYCNNHDFLGGEGRQLDYEGDSFQITVYKKDFKVPSWLGSGIMYQIFPDRFYRSGEIIKKDGDRGYFIHDKWGENPKHTLKDIHGEYSSSDFFGGNLYGVIEKLDYLKELGVSIIYLNPVFDAYSNHKYDTGDYENIDQMFGGNHAFEALAAAAKDKGIKIILDGVFNHTGSDSKYFNKDNRYDSVGAFQSKDSPYYSWYRFEDYPKEYDSWWGIKSLPNVNETEPSFKDYIINNKDSMIRRWIRLGASGWRLDVADELPEEFLKALYTAALDENPEAVIIGEVWEDASNKISYGQLREYLLGEDMHSVMNYPLKDSLLDYLLGRITSHQFVRIVMSLKENYPATVFYSLMNILGTHDTPRALTVLGGAPSRFAISREEQSSYQLSSSQREVAEKRLRLASLVQFTLPGTPCIYYGDEAGMDGMADPFNRRCYPWGSEDTSLINWYKDIAQLRLLSPALVTGRLDFISSDEDMLAYIRYTEKGLDIFNNSCDNQFFLIIINRSTTQRKSLYVNLAQYGISTLTDLDGNIKSSSTDGKFSFPVDPLSSLVLKAHKTEQ